MFPNMFMALVDAAIPPKPNAEILINFLLEVDMSYFNFTAVKVFMAFSPFYDKCHKSPKGLVTLVTSTSIKDAFQKGLYF